MDDFLVSLYEEEQEKIAAADLGDFMGTLPVDELEDFLGLTKEAVSGPPEPVLPSGTLEKRNKEQKKAEAAVQGRDSKDIEKDSQGIGDVGMGGGGMGGGLGGGVGGGGMETTASIKANIVRRVMNVTAGAPPHIKLAASQFAGVELAKVKAIDKDLRRKEKEQAIIEKMTSSGRRGFRGAALGSVVGALPFALSSYPKAAPIGMALGGALGAGIGVSRARQLRKALAQEQQKTAASDEYSVKPGYWAGTRAAGRAIKGGNKFFASGDYLKKSIKGELKGGAKGAAIGGGLGALVGGGASLLSRGKIPLGEALATGGLVGGGVGTFGGGMVGSAKAHKKFLADKGIKEKFLGNRLTPEAAQAYLNEKELAKAKTAASDEYSVKPGYWAGNRAVTEATRSQRTKWLPSKEYAIDQLKGSVKGGLKGGAIGGGLGALGGGALSLLSKGAIPMKTGVGIMGATGAGLGAMTGDLIGGGRAHKKFMARKGIKESLLGNRMTPEAAQRYLSKEELAKAKTAASDEHSVKPGSWFSGRKAMTKALSREYADNPETGKGLSKATLKGWLGGTGAGAGLGTGLGAGASLLSRGKIPMRDALAIGGVGGAGIGSLVGMGAMGQRHQNRTLAEKGIKMTGLGFGRGRMTPEAAKEYMTEKDLAKAKTAMIASIRTNQTSMDPEVAGKQGARTGRIVGGLSGAALGNLLTHGMGAKGRALGLAGGAAAGTLGGHLVGKSSGKKSSDLRRAQVMGDMRQRLEMIKQLRAENAAK
jgi:hypothetical protein